MCWYPSLCALIPRFPSVLSPGVCRIAVTWILLGRWEWYVFSVILLRYVKYFITTLCPVLPFSLFLALLFSNTKGASERLRKRRSLVVFNVVWSSWHSELVFLGCLFFFLNHLMHALLFLSRSPFLWLLQSDVHSFGRNKFGMVRSSFHHYVCSL